MKIRYIIGLLLLSGCSQNTPEETAAGAAAPETVRLTAAQEKTAGLETGRFTEREMRGSIQVTGILDAPPQHVASITVPYGAFLKSTEMLQGMQVRRGQVLAEIEHPDFLTTQQEYLELRAEMGFLEAEWKRQEELAREQVNSGKALQQARADYDRAAARLQGLRARLEMMRISLSQLDAGHLQRTVALTAPIDGYVTQVNVTPGAYLHPGDVAFMIVNTAHLHAELRVFEKDLPQLREGQEVRFRLTSDAQERGAHVHLIGRELDADRTVRVHCHLDQEDQGLIPGMYLTATVKTGGQKAWVVPDPAVVMFEGKRFVFVRPLEARDAGYEMLEVLPGNTEEGFTAVTLPPGTAPEKLELVTRGAFSLLSKLKNSEEE